MMNQNHHRHMVALYTLKWLGLTGMIVIHVFFWLLSSKDVSLSAEGLAFQEWITKLVYLGYFPLSLPILAGAMHRVRDEAIPEGRKHDILKAGKISLVLVLLGYLMNALAWGWSYFWDWDVLGFIGVSFLLMTLALKVSRYLLYGAGLSAVLLNKAAYTFVSQLPAGLKGTYLVNVIASTSAHSFYWPLVPWFCLPVFGYFIYDFLLSPALREGRKTAIFYGITCAALLGLLALSKPAPWRFDPAHIWGAWLFHPGSATLYAIMAIFVFFSAACYYSYHHLEKLQWLTRPFGAGILWIYLFQEIAGYRLTSCLKQLCNPLLAFFPVVFFMVLSSWGIGSLVLYLHNHQFEFVLRKVGKRGGE